ncbi:hypothetical protein DHOM_05080 [Dermabacter hominis 1368]|uniref:Uncharacterized protein n=2 Tax=Dermabacter TaxID=36739 RepID=A0A1B0ZJA5_9MICO|nr:hypothetical protein [Dermabacter vaginalis]ANP27990.1 hypothetical protein DAD186_14400 [Dermabacter vaginalis]KDS93587.1 hypothetical protein DHOM_05080 [Dermabacter hominis 1368]
MPATYFTRGRGHSRRGQEARDNGALPWSQLPASYRRGLTSAQAKELDISNEWHHAGKYATEVYVYYPEAVAAYWDTLEARGYTAKMIRANWDAISHRTMRGLEDENLWHALHEATNAAMDAVDEILEEE